MSHVGRARAAQRERRPDHCRAWMSDRLAGRLDTAAAGGDQSLWGKS